MKTPYEILEVSIDASLYEIKDAFRRKAKLTHPDLNQYDERANEKFVEVTEAYKILCDPVLKSDLDKKIRESDQYSGFEFDFTYGQDSQMMSEIIKDLIFRMQLQAEPYKKEASRALWVGLAWLFGGLIITLWSYSAATSNGGGTYVVTYGAIIFGMFQAVRGFMEYNQINNLVSDYEKDLWDKFDAIMAKSTTTSKSSYYSDNKQKYNHNSSNTSDGNSPESDKNYGETDNTQVIIDDNLSKPVLFGSLFIIIVIILVIGSGSNNTYVDTSQQPRTQQTTEAIVHADNYLSADDMRLLTGEINYDNATYFMSNQYTTDELINLMEVLNKLDYEIDIKRADSKYLLIAAVVHFQMENNLEVDGMAGPNTLKTLAIALTKKSEGSNVDYYISSDSSVVKEYGWNSQKVDDFIYFVSYDFDYDNNYNNGYYLYPYEVNLRNQAVISVEGALLDKYRKLGYLN